jgi:hypothetical protein
VTHPVPARLLAYARYRIDFEKEVEKHLKACAECAQFVARALEPERKPEVIGRVRKA